MELICELALALHVGHGNRYTSRREMPADLALLRVVQAAVSTAPVDL
jgi:hypothetical protein